MNRSKLRLSVGILASVLLAASPAMAQSDQPIMDAGTQVFTAFAGGQFFDIGDQLNRITDPLQTEMSYGVRYQANITPHFGLEGNFMYSPAQFEFLGPEPAGQGTTDLNAFYYNGNVVYNITPASRVIPYITGGAGAVSLVVDDPALESTETKFAGNFGGGVLFAFNERFGLRFDVRDYVYRVDELDTQFRHAFNVPAGFEETVHDVNITGGLSILF
jgi:outer membrane beta-barrel protein